jgi:N-acetylglucosamine-6-sulfatase
MNRKNAIRPFGAWGANGQRVGRSLPTDARAQLARPDGRRRKRRLGVVAVFLLALVAALAGSAQERTSLATPAAEAKSTAKQKRPNIVVVMSDDQTVESVRVMSNLQRLLMREGTTFDNSFASYPLCCPSRATFLTGQYAHNHTVMGNSPPEGGYVKLDHSNTLPVWLRRSGYYTAHIGKYLNGYGNPSRGAASTTEVPAGWTNWQGSIDPSTYQFYNYTLNENGRLVQYGSDPASYQADVYTRKAVEIIRQRARSTRPFFLSVAYLAPHSGGPRTAQDPPNQATPEPAPRHQNDFESQALPRPPSFNEADVSDKPAVIRNRNPLRPAQIRGIEENYQQRLESILAIDEGLAAMVAALRQAGELSNTLFIFTADNGFFHGEHRVPSGKVLVYEPSIRVPLVIRGPGFGKNKHVSDLVANIDVAATILAAAKVKARRVLDGRALQPFGKRPSTNWNRDILLETGAAGRQGQNRYTAIRTHRHVYVEYANGDRELYDLQADPHQLTSLHADPASASLRQQLASRLARLRTCKGAACRTGGS